MSGDDHQLVVAAVVREGGGPEGLGVQELREGRGDPPRRLPQRLAPEVDTERAQAARPPPARRARGQRPGRASPAAPARPGDCRWCGSLRAGEPSGWSGWGCGRRGRPLRTTRIPSAIMALSFVGCERLSLARQVLGRVPRDRPGYCHERTKALVILAACGAPREMGLRAGDRGVGVTAGELQLDVAVELLEALLAADLGPAGPEQPREQLSCDVVVAPSASSFLPVVEGECRARPAARAACGARRAGSCRGRRGSCRGARRARRSARRSARARRARRAGAASAPRAIAVAAAARAARRCSASSSRRGPRARRAAPTPRARAAPRGPATRAGAASRAASSSANL